METARVDIRKLQLLNDRITQCLEALAQVRLSVHGLQPGTGMGSMLGQTSQLGGFQGGQFQGSQFQGGQDPRFAQQTQMPQPYGAFGSFIPPMQYGGLSHTGIGQQPGGFPPPFGQQQNPFAQQNPLLQQQGTFPQQQNPYLQQQGTFPQQQNPFLQQQGTFPQQQNPYLQQQTPFTQQQNPWLQQQSPFAQQQNPYAQQNPFLQQLQIPSGQQSQMPFGQQSPYAQQQTPWAQQVPFGMQQQAPPWAQQQTPWSQPFGNPMQSGQAAGWGLNSGLSHTPIDEALYARPLWADPMLASRVRETFPYAGFALSPFGPFF
jgi:hypothetical protein